MSQKSMHEKHKFSFGHIIAFLALLAIGYVIFTAITYYLTGNYFLGAVGASAICLSLLLLLMRLGLLKGVNENFEKAVVHERLTFVALTLVILPSFLVFSHFWTVKSKESGIAERFAQAGLVSRQLFDDYDEYALNRFKAYGNEVEKRYVQRRDTMPTHVLNKGLMLQLMPENYRQLKEDVKVWLSKSDSSLSVWNVFLIGNIDNVCAGMRSWNRMMEEMSRHRMNYESPTVDTFSHDEMIETSVAILSEVREDYTTVGPPLPEAWLTGMLFLLLYLPWLVQRRSPRSLVTFLGKRKIVRHRSQTIDIVDGVPVAHRGRSISETSNAENRHRAMSIDDRNE